MLYLTRRKSIYWFRRRLPRAITAATGRTEIVRSLATADHFAASRRARHAAHLVDKLLAALCAEIKRMQSQLTPDDLDRLLDRVFHLVVEDLTEQSTPSGPLDPFAMQTMRDRYGPDVIALGLMTPEEVEAAETINGRPANAIWNENEDLISHYIGEYSSYIEINDSSPIRKFLEAAIAVENLPIAADNPRLTRPALNAAISAARQVLQQLRGETVYTPRPRTMMPAAPLPAPAPLPPVTDTVSTFVEAWVTHKRKTAGWNAASERVNRGSVDMFIRTLGDRTLDSYKRQEIEKFRDLMEQLPDNYRKSPKHAEMSLQEIIADKDDEALTLTKSTLDQHWQRMRGFLEWVRTRENAAKPDLTALFDRLGWSVDVPLGNKRLAWTDTALDFLFQTPIWTGSQYDPESPHRRAEKGERIVKDEYFWIPLIGLFHGLRLEEAARLKRESIFEMDGIPVMYIDRGLKTQSSKRVVPIHKMLISFGFLDFVHDIGRDERLFPGTRPYGKDQKYSHLLSEYFSAYRKKFKDDQGQFVIYKPLMDFHSFRTTATTKMINASAAGAQTMLVVDCVTGHDSEARQEMHSRQSMSLTYFAGSELADMQKVINSIAFENVRFDHLVQQTHRTKIGIERATEIRAEWAGTNRQQSRTSFRRASNRA